jgi:hypothetical protein
MLWQVYNGGSLDIVANEAITIDDSKYSVSKNSSSGKYYRLNIKNVEASDAKKYKCSGINKAFYLQLDLLGRCNYRHKKNSSAARCNYILQCFLQSSANLAASNAKTTSKMSQSQKI